MPLFAQSLTLDTLLINQGNHVRKEYHQRRTDWTIIY